MLNHNRTFKDVMRWAKAIADRAAVKRGVIVNRTFDDPAGQLPERHSAADIDAAMGAGRK